MTHDTYVISRPDAGEHQAACHTCGYVGDVQREGYEAAMDADRHRADTREG